MLGQFSYPSWAPNKNTHWIEFEDCFWLKNGEDSWYCVYEFDDGVVMLTRDNLPEFKFFFQSSIRKEMYYSTSKDKYNIETDDENLLYRIVKSE